MRPRDRRVVKIFAAEARVGFDRRRRGFPTVRNHGHPLRGHGIVLHHALLRKVRDGDDPLGPRHGIAVAPPAEKPLARRKVLRQEQMIQIVDDQGTGGGHVFGEDRLLREEHHVRLQLIQHPLDLAGPIRARGLQPAGTQDLPARSRRSRPGRCREKCFPGPGPDPSARRSRVAVRPAASRG